MRHVPQENQSHCRTRNHSIMIRVACLLLLSAPAARAAPPAPPAAPSRLSRDAELRPLPVRTAGDYGDRPEDLLIRTLWKFKRNAPAEGTDSDHDSRKQFIVKLLCRKNEQCTHTQVYEFDLLRVEPSDSGTGVYY